jgi:Leucine-rich repeat (LRR) protein
MTRTIAAGSIALVLGWFAIGYLGGCDEKPRAPGAASAAPAPSPLPVVASAVPAASEARPSVAPHQTKPKKRARDCPKGMPKIDNREVEAAIRLKAQNPTEPLSLADLRKVRSLNISQITITELDICLFQHMTELKELFIGRGEVDDLRPIAALTKLESLRLSLNPITDLEPLSKMVKLQRVDLGHTQVKDLSPLTAATRLTELMLDDTQVQDITPLTKLEKLKILSLKNTPVKDIKPLKALKALKSLDIRGSGVEDASVVMRPGLYVLQH